MSYHDRVRRMEAGLRLSKAKAARSGRPALPRIKRPKIKPGDRHLRLRSGRTVSRPPAGHPGHVSGWPDPVAGSGWAEVYSNKAMAAIGAGDIPAVAPQPKGLGCLTRGRT